MKKISRFYLDVKLIQNSIRSKIVRLRLRLNCLIENLKEIRTISLLLLSIYRLMKNKLFFPL